MAPAKPRSARSDARNVQLEEKLVSDPDNAATRAVFADWLQSINDPWGELIALVCANKTAMAARFLKEHADSLEGGFGARTFTWRGGFIDVVTLERKVSASVVAEVFALRTTLLVRELYLPTTPTTELIRAVSTHAPGALRRLVTALAEPIAALAVPSLQRLSLWVERKPLDVASFSVLFGGAKLPALRHLHLYSNFVPLDFIAALLNSELLRQLTSLEITQYALSDEAAELLVRRKVKLAHLAYVDFGATTDAVEAAFREQLDAKHHDAED